LCSALPGCPASIGCDWTSAFYAKGNCTAYSPLKKYPECMGSFEQLENYFKATSHYSGSSRTICLLTL